jgi:hypothetical protein
MIDDALRQSKPSVLAGALGTAPPVIKPSLPTGPKPAPAPAVAPEPVVPKTGDALIAAGRVSSDENEISRAMVAATEAKQKADNDLVAEEQRQKAASTEREAKIAEDYATKFKTTSDKQKDMLNSSYGYFTPSKETAKDIAGIFSLMTLATMGAGTQSKYSGMNALANLTGAMKGYKEGREDLYKKEMASYDKNVAEFARRTDNSLKEMRLALDELSVDKDAAIARARAVAAADTGSIAALKIRSGDYEGAIKALQHQHDAVQKLKAEKDKLQQKHEEFLMNQGNLNVYRSGQLDLRRDMIDLAKLKEAGKKGSAADRYGFGDIVAGASNEAAAAIKNLMGLPIESTSGWFGTGKVSNSLFTAPMDVFANKLTPESVQRYNVQSGKLGYNLAQLMSGGRAVRVSDVDQMNKILSIREGDTMETAATRIAEARQLAERTMEVRLKSPNTPPGLKDVFKENLETIQAVVPFTVDDVNKFVNSRDENVTFSDALNKKYNSGATAPKGTGTAADPIKLD